MAQAANMSTEAFENLYFDVCTMNYPKMAKAMIPLERRMRKANRVHLKSPGTDLTFSIKGIGAKMCKGDRNIPDGEVFTAPVRDSINGVIHYNTPSVYQGTTFRNVRFAAQTLVAVLVIFTPAAGIPECLSVAFERQDMSRDPVQKPAVVTDDDRRLSREIDGLRNRDRPPA